MNQERTYKVIIAGGGTGGHIFPAVAIANALQSQWAKVEILFVGALGKMEMKKVPLAGFKIVGLDIAGFNRNNLLKNWSLPFKLLKSRRKAKQILTEMKPDIAIGVGGFASYPILSAAQKMGIPTLIQEQNSFAGKSNKFLAKRADGICVAYEGMDKFFPKDKIVITGNPVRHSIAFSDLSHEEGLQAFGLRSDKKTLLVVGGSLGARSINRTIEAGIETLKAMNIQLIWQTGKLFFEQAKACVRDVPGMVVTEFITKMEEAYTAADWVISRAGALAISELCIVAKPVIFVPYPYAAEDHQTSNAMALVDHNAALMVKDNEVDEDLLPKLKMMIGDEDMQQIMKEELKRLAIKDADVQIAKRVASIINGN